MASARKKQDEKNLKILRELVSLPHNKHCFDCHQRGPTYVNVTIGSFVCTKCSGLLRGLTPPHRVKSISMATFTNEEIDLVKNRGNDYCQKVWLGLYEGSKPSDEFGVHTLMLDKYERKRYYMEPSVALRNGYNSNNVNVKAATETNGKAEVQKNRLNGNSSDNNNGAVVTSSNGTADFVADFAHADIFNANGADSSATNQVSFANFDNNPIFSNETQSGTTNEDFSIFDLQFTNCGPVYNHVSLFPKMNLNRWNLQSQQQQQHQHQQQMNGKVNGFSNGVIMDQRPQNGTTPQKMMAAFTSQPPPSVDRYAALKDLDNEIKSQTATMDWSSAGSNSSLYNSPNTPGSLYSSTASPQSSSYGSPTSQGQFMNLFPSANEAQTMNPFNVVNGMMNGGGTWTSFNGNPNPFRASPSPDYFSNMNGSDNMQSVFGKPIINGTNWTPNPFKVANGHSSNPFL